MSENFWGRFIIFVVLIFLVNTWTLHHFDRNLWNLPIVNGLLVLIAIGKFMLKSWGKNRQKEFSQIIRRILYFFLEPPVLALFFGLFILASLLISSVTVLSSGLVENAGVYLSPEGQRSSNKNSKDNDKLEGPSTVIRFTRFTTPFGRPFYLEVEGFIRYSFDLYPWTGKTVRVTQDLQAEPSILIRIPTEVFDVVSRGKLEILLGGNRMPDMKCVVGSGSILIGRDISLPPSFKENWKMQILAAGNTNEVQTATYLSAWQNPQKINPDVSLMPGMKIEARLKIGDVVLARAEFQIGEEKIQDIKMSMEK